MPSRRGGGGNLHAGELCELDGVLSDGCGSGPDEDPFALGLAQVCRRGRAWEAETEVESLGRRSERDGRGRRLRRGDVVGHDERHVPFALDKLGVRAVGLALPTAHEAAARLAFNFGRDVRAGCDDGADKVAAGNVAGRGEAERDVLPVAVGMQKVGERDGASDGQLAKSCAGLVELTSGLAGQRGEAGASDAELISCGTRLHRSQPTLGDCQDLEEDLLRAKVARDGLLLDCGRLAFLDDDGLHGGWDRHVAECDVVE